MKKSNEREANSLTRGLSGANVAMPLRVHREIYSYSLTESTVFRLPRCLNVDGNLRDSKICCDGEFKSMGVY